MNLLDISGLIYFWKKIKENINETAEKKADLDLEGKIPIGQLPVGSTSHHGALKVKEGNGLSVIGGVLSFQLTEVAIPAQEGTLTYTGSAQSPSWSNYNSAQLTIGGTTSGTNAGNYTATFTPTSNYKWSDGTTATKSVTWTIGKTTGSLSISRSGKRKQLLLHVQVMAQSLQKAATLRLQLSL